MTALAPRLYETRYGRLLGGVGIDRRRGGWLHFPSNRLKRNGEVGVNLVVERVFAFEQRLHLRQEQSRLGALDHTMIVGAGHRHDLAEAQRNTAVFRHTAIFRRVTDGAGSDNGALSGHKSRNGTAGTDCT